MAAAPPAYGSAGVPAGQPVNQSPGVQVGGAIWGNQMQVDGRYLAEWDHAKRQRFDDLASKMEWSPEAIQKAWMISNSQVVIIVDDSGSMGANLSQSYLPQPVRRWDELKHFLSLVVPICSHLCGGCNVHFLNGPPPPSPVRVIEELSLDQRQPGGRTPLIGALNHVFQTYRPSQSEKPLLLIITTDGAPSDGTKDQLKAVIQNRPDINKSFVSFLVCSDNDADVEYLDSIDTGVKNVDVTDDFLSERKQVASARRKIFSNFTIGDWALKAVVGPAVPEWDQLDEKKGCSCTIL